METHPNVRLSYADATACALVRRLDIPRVLTFDSDFTILLPERDPEEVLACVAVAAASLQTGISLRDHLMRQNHLEVEQHPYIRLAVREARVLEQLAPGRLRAEVRMFRRI